MGNTMRSNMGSRRVAASGWVAIVFGVILALLGWGPAVAASSQGASPQPDQQFLNRVCGDQPPASEAHAVTPEFCSMETRMVQLVDDNGDTVELQVLVARDNRQRQAGYQHIGREVIAQTTILFVFPFETSGAFHMCNVRASLDIAWVRADGSILDIQRMDPGPSHSPFGCPQTYAPQASGAYRFALETPAGYFSANEISADAARLVVEP